MDRLKKELHQLLATSPNYETVQERLTHLVSVYPFNEYEYIITHLLDADILTLEEYQRIRKEYIDRNRYLNVFEISSPRKFGESWAQNHLKQFVPELEKPTKEKDRDYEGQYDLLLDDRIRVEVKASRVVDSDRDAPLYQKALSSESRRRFWMNFQQIKPRCCDVFVWVAVWRDVVRYWVLSSRELEHHPEYSRSQHRGNIGEGQIHVRESNIEEFRRFEESPSRIGEAIRAAWKRQVGKF